MADWSNDADWSNEDDWSSIGGVEEEVISIEITFVGDGVW